MSDERAVDPAYRHGGALIVGGTGTIGQAVCAAFAKAGSKIGVCYARQADTARTVAEELHTRHGTVAQPFAIDTTDPAAIRAGVHDAASAFGGLHTVVYTAGPAFPSRPLADTAADTWSRAITADLLGCLELMRVSAPELRKTRGSLVAVTTYQARRAAIGGSVSAVSKAAIDQAVTSLAREEGPNGVRANTVQVGWIDGHRARSQLARDPRTAQRKKSSIALGRLGRPDEVATAIEFLASSRATFITGATIPVDGGDSI